MVLDGYKVICIYCVFRHWVKRFLEKKKTNILGRPFCLFVERSRAHSQQFTQITELVAWRSHAHSEQFTQITELVAWRSRVHSQQLTQITGLGGSLS